MTDEQLEVAKRHVEYHAKKFGYKSSNVSFVQGYIEDLKSAGIRDNSVDVVVSNCVINLSGDKRRVFAEIRRVLKQGGELYFSDVFCDRRIPSHLSQDQVLLGECLAGAMYIHDFRRMLQSLGWPEYRVVKASVLGIDNPVIANKIGMCQFQSLTIRAPKVDMEDICENYGHVAYYLGTIPECPHGFTLDDHHYFATGLPYPVCGNTANILLQTRFQKHFRIAGDFSTHYGAFACGSAPKAPIEKTSCC
jgi:SAM-dependent methyltransferase